MDGRNQEGGCEPDLTLSCSGDNHTHQHGHVERLHFAKLRHEKSLERYNAQNKCHGGEDVAKVRLYQKVQALIPAD